MNKKPEAHITVGKNRVSKGRTSILGQEVYLNDGTEFEIELYNPTQGIIAAEIHLNGKRMQGGMLVLKPAQRIFLEGYLNEKRKFKFSTYDVSGTQEEIKEAIKNNGELKVKFFKEREYNDSYINILNTGLFYGNDNGWNNTGAPLNSNFYNTTATYGFNSNIWDSPKEIQSSNDITESGMIEKGSVYNQIFEHVSYKFEKLEFSTIQYILLPLSRGAVHSESANAKIYCTSCKFRKRKTTWKFCPKCGEEFEF